MYSWVFLQVLQLPPTVQDMQIGVWLIGDSVWMGFVSVCCPCDTLAADFTLPLAQCQLGSPMDGWITNLTEFSNITTRTYYILSGLFLIGTPNPPPPSTDKWALKNLALNSQSISDMLLFVWPLQKPQCNLHTVVEPDYRLWKSWCAILNCCSNPWINPSVWLRCFIFRSFYTALLLESLPLCLIHPLHVPAAQRPVFPLTTLALCGKKERRLFKHRSCL